MTSYRLFPATNGPGSVTSYSGSFQAGVAFEATKAGCWFEGYWWWCPAGGDTGAQKFALWASTGSSSGTLVSAATVTSGTLTAGAWNYVALGTPVPLGAGTQYVAATAYTAVNGFPDTGASFGSGETYSAGIVNGPLTAYSDAGGSNVSAWGTSQGMFGVATNDPTVSIPGLGSDTHSNFWVDVQIRDTPPAGYLGSYRLWPNTYLPNVITTNDSATNYVVATEVHLDRPCAVNNIWYYSPAGTAQLATRASVYSITGTDSGTELIAVTSPSWSGAAASGWVSCSAGTPAPVLPAGSYKVAVYNSAGSPDGWSAKDAGTNYWDTGAGGAGFTTGPLTAPGLAGASLAYEYNVSLPLSTPPYTNGSTEAGQCTFAQTGPQYPYLYVDGLAQNYWLDLEVTPVPPGTFPSGTRPSRTWTGRFRAGQKPQIPRFVPATVPLADTDTGTGTDGGESIAASAPSSSDTGHGTDAGESTAATLPSSDSGHGTDAGETISPSTLASADTGTGTDSGTPTYATLSDSDSAQGTETVTSAFSADAGSGTDAGESLAVALSSSDVVHGNDAGENVVASGVFYDADAGSGTDGGESIAAALSSSDAGTGTDAGLVPLGFDAGTGTDAGEVVTVLGADAAAGTDSAVVGQSSSDSAAGTDAGESIAAALPSSDAGSGTDGGESIAAALSSSDSGSGTDAGSIAAALASTDAGHGTDAGEGTAATVVTADAGHGTDAGETVRVSDADAGFSSERVSSVFGTDAGHGTDAGESLAVALSDTDAGTGTDAGESLAAALADTDVSSSDDEGLVLAPSAFPAAAQPSPAWVNRFGPRSRLRQVQFFLPPPSAVLVTDSDACLGEDAEIDNPGALDSDTVTGTDSGYLSAVSVSDSDAGHGTEGQVQAGASDSDTAAGTDSGYLSAAQFFASDSSLAFDQESDVFGPNAHVSDADGCSGTEGQVIDVYAFQPPFRFDGGHYGGRGGGAP